MAPRLTVVLASASVLDRDTLRSLDRQDLPAEDVEILVVRAGDGRPDDARMRRLTANRPNARFHAATGSGTLGERLDVGAALASGEYVLFLDDGVLLGEQALAGLCDLADDESADICIGRTSRADTPVRFAPGGAAGETEPPALPDAGRIYRRSFLASTGVRFSASPDASTLVATGLELLSRSSAVSFLAHHPAFVVPAGGHPLVDLAERLEDVAASGAPETVRAAAMLAVHARGLDVAAATATALDGASTAALERYRAAVGALVPSPLDQRLAGGQRALSRQLRAGDIGTPAATAGAQRTRLRVGDVAGGWSRGTLTLSLQLRYGDDGPESADALSRLAVGAGVHRVADGEQWPVPTDDLTVAAGPDGRSVRVTAHLRPRDLAGGEPLTDGRWVPYLQVTEDAVTRRLRLPAPPRVLGAAHTGGQTVVSFRDGKLLALDVGAADAPVLGRVDAALASVTEDHRGTLLEVRLPQVDLAPGDELVGHLAIGRLPVPARIRVVEGRTVLQAWVSGLAGSYRLTTQFSAAPYAPLGLVLDVDQVGRMRVRPPRRARGASSATTGGVGSRHGSRLRGAVAGVPGAARVYRRLRTTVLTMRTRVRSRRPAARGAGR